MSMSRIIRCFNTPVNTTQSNKFIPHRSYEFAKYLRDYNYAVIGKNIIINKYLKYKIINKCVNFTTGEKMLYISVSRKDNIYNIVISCDEFEEMCKRELKSI